MNSSTVMGQMFTPEFRRTRSTALTCGHDGAMPQRPALRIRGLAIGHGAVRVAQDIDCDFAPASLTAIVGGNGCGKSTLLKTLLGQLKPMAGRIELTHAKRDMAYLSQLSEINRDFPMTVCDFVGLGAWSQASWWRSLGRGDAMTRALDAIAAVGLRGLEARWISDLSGGQFQRVRFARLMMQAAPLVLLDEPFAAIDSQTTADLLCLIDQWQQAGTTVVAVLHDLPMVKTHFPYTLRMDTPGGPQWGATAEVLNDLVITAKGVHAPAAPARPDKAYA